MEVIDLFNKIYLGEIKPGTKFKYNGDIIIYNGVSFHNYDDGSWYCLDAEDLRNDIELI